MDGVTVLNVIETHEAGIIIGFTTVFIISVILLIISINLFVDGDSKVGIIGTICGVIFLALSIALLFLPGKNTYEVTLSDDVNMDEFITRYQIIEQRGKIFVVAERPTQN